MSRVPPFSLDRVVADLRPAIEERWSKLLDTTAFVGGPEVTAFEEAFADFLGTGGCVGVANGTDALIVAMRALDLAPGAEVIVPSFTFVATATTVVMAGGVPVFADIERDSFNIDLESVAGKITERTVGVIGVHLFGRPFDVEAAAELCRRHGLWLIEDAAQAHGASVGGRRVGTFGELTTWSFYPSKNLGCFGDGGAVNGADADLVARVRRIANHGRTAQYGHAEIGLNSRLDGLQAAVLNSRLPSLDEDNRRRIEIARRYGEALADFPEVTAPGEPDDAVAVYHQFTLLTERRDELKAFLGDRGIGSVVYYPAPSHLQPVFPEAHDLDLPVSTAASREVLSLPMFPQLTDDEVDRVIAALREFFGS